MRKATLASLFSRVSPGLRFNEDIDENDGPLVFARACKLGMERIAAGWSGSPQHTVKSAMLS